MLQIANQILPTYYMKAEANLEHHTLSRLTSALGFTSLGVAFSKALTLISFFTAASVLSADQIGIYSYAIGAFGLLLCYQSGSVGPLLIQRRVWRQGLLESYLSYSFLANIFMVSIAGIYLVFESPKTASVILIGLSMMLNGLFSVGQTFHRAKLVSNLNFRAAALFDIALATIQCISFLTALFILKDERAYAFGFLGVFICNLLAIIWGNYFIWPRFKQAREIFPDARHLVTSSIASQATFFLPLFLVSRYTDLETAAQFYFASQLVMAFGVLVQKPLQSSILPLTRTLQDNSKDAINIMSSTLLKVCAIFCTLSLCIAFSLDDLIFYIWEEKWLSAASVVHLAIIAVVIKVLTFAQIGLIEAEGRWRVKNYFSIFELSIVILSCIYAINMATSFYELAYIIFIGHSIANIISQFIISKILQTRISIYLFMQIFFAIVIILYA